MGYLTLLTSPMTDLNGQIFYMPVKFHFTINFSQYFHFYNQFNGINYLQPYILAC